jgi:hypothetical protein
MAATQIRKPQARILAFLLKASPSTRATIAAKAPVDVAACVEYLGSDDPAIRKANDKRHFPSLVSLGFVKAEEGAAKKDKAGKLLETAGPTQYSITASGKKALADYDKEAEAKEAAKSKPKAAKKAPAKKAAKKAPAKKAAKKAAAKKAPAGPPKPLRKQAEGAPTLSVVSEAG